MGRGRGSENTPTVASGHQYALFTYDTSDHAVVPIVTVCSAKQNKHSIVIIVDQCRANHPQMTYITQEGHGDWHEPRDGVIVHSSTVNDFRARDKRRP